MRNLSMFLAGVAVLAFVATSCRTAPSSPYVPVTEQGVATVDMDFKDYQLAASKIVESMTKRGLPPRFVVALGPVDTSGTTASVDVRMLQDRMASLLDAEGTLRFMSAVDAMTGDNAAAELYKIVEWNWWHNNPVDAEDLQKFGQLANVDGLLFGRVSSIKRRLPDGGTEVTYTFSWKFTDTRTGVDICRPMYDVRKNIR